MLSGFYLKGNEAISKMRFKDPSAYLLYVLIYFPTKVSISFYKSTAYQVNLSIYFYIIYKYIIYPSVHLSIYLLMFLADYRPTDLHIHLAFHAPIHFTITPSTYQPITLPSYIFIYVIWLFTHPYIVFFIVHNVYYISFYCINNNIIALYINIYLSIHVSIFLSSIYISNYTSNIIIYIFFFVCLSIVDDIFM